MRKRVRATYHDGTPLRHRLVSSSPAPCHQPQAGFEVRVMLFRFRFLSCSFAAWLKGRSSRSLRTTGCTYILENSSCFFVAASWAPLSWTMSKPLLLSTTFVMFWIASMSCAILPPSCRIRHKQFTVISLPPAAWNLTLLRVPWCHRGSPNTLGRFQCVLDILHPFDLRSKCVGCKSKQKNQNQRTVERTELRMCKSVKCKTRVRDGKDDSLVISRLFTNLLNSLPISTGFLICRHVPFALARSFSLLLLLYFSLPFLWSSPFLSSPLTDVSLLGMSF